MFSELQAYKQAHGDFNVPQLSKEHSKLAKWITRQRATRGVLSSLRQSRLDAIGFEWEPKSAYWEKMFAELEAYKFVHGDCNVPRAWPANPDLAVWVGTRRTAEQTMSPSLKARLDALGFIWNPHDATWEKMFAMLATYAKAHGHCNVRRGWTENPALATWAQTQRSNRATLSPERVARLEALSFQWEPIAAAWEEMFASLEGYKETFGDCNVPNQWTENQKLGSWVNTQRLFHRQGKLSSERKSRLEGLGFVWDTRETYWEQMFAALVDFKEQHGHCNVPAKWDQNPKLGTWVTAQRSNRTSLSDERKERLNTQGFIWKPQKGPRSG